MVRGSKNSRIRGSRFKVPSSKVKGIFLEPLNPGLLESFYTLSIALLSANKTERGRMQGGKGLQKLVTKVLN